MADHTFFGKWATVSPPAEWKFSVARGKPGDTLFGYHPGNGTLWMADSYFAQILWYEGLP
jgi:hypothetical protein